MMGCAFLLGGGVSFYQTAKFYLQQQHLAQGDSKVRDRTAVRAGRPAGRPLPAELH